MVCAMRKAGVLSILFVYGVFASCAPTMSLVRPPESYKGPIAEKPVFLQGDYWVFERGNLAKIRSTALATNIEFPLWVGETWRYDGEALRAGQPATSKAPRFPTRIDCYVTAFKQVTVTAGTFDAFECECRCELIAAGRYEPGCGEWTIWYAPEAKNLIRTRTGSTETSVELIEYRASPPKS
jgi:hypothetical protein